jgi:hypothetical protein
MIYRLIITDPTGNEFDAETDGPLTTRADAGMYAGLALAGIRVPGQSPGVLIHEGVLIHQMRAFDRRVQAAPLGENVLHEPTGYRFRTEES